VDSAASAAVRLLQGERLSKTGEFRKKVHAFSERRQQARIQQSSLSQVLHF